MRLPLSLVAFGFAVLPALAAAQAPVGGEFQVNPFTSQYQSNGGVAMDRNGGFVVVWTDGYTRLSEGDCCFQYFITRGLFGRRYDAAGEPLGGPFQVASHTSSRLTYQSVAGDPEGAFVVTWQQGGDVFLRSFAEDGSAGEPVHVNPGGVGGFAITAAQPAQGFVVVWDEGPWEASFVAARVFDPAGAPRSGELAVSAAYHQSLVRTSLAADAEGRFVVVWSSDSPGDGSGAGIFARRHDATGAALGPPVQVNVFTTGQQTIPAVAMGADGRFVVAWRRRAGTTDIVTARLFGAAGESLGGEFQVNGASRARTYGIVSAMDDDGRFVIAWEDWDFNRAERSEVFLRRFDTSGTPLSDDVRVNTYTTGFQRTPAISTDGLGHFVVTWNSEGQDGSQHGVFAQRFGPDVIFADGFESGSLAAWSAAHADGGDLAVSADASMAATTAGAEGHVDDNTSLYVQDDSPRGEHRYRARFFFDPGDFDPGEAQGHFRARLFVAFEENPSRRLFAVVLRRRDAQYAVMGRVRLADDRQWNGGFVPIGPGPHLVELEWTRGAAAGDLGSFQMWVDGATAGGSGALPNARGAVDYVRLGALGLKAGASGTMSWDEFASRRAGPFTP